MTQHEPQQIPIVRPRAPYHIPETYIVEAATHLDIGEPLAGASVSPPRSTTSRVARFVSPTKAVEPIAEDACAHHRLVEFRNGQQVGVCKKCGDVKDYAEQ